MASGATCSGLSLALDEPLAGTAGHTLAWLLVEQPGPWGRVALRESQLDPDIGAELETRCSQAGVNPFLIKRPGRGDAPQRRRHVFVVSSHPGKAWVRRLELGDPRELLELDLGALGRGEAIGGEAVEGPLFLVCTNGKRDACCAQIGRPIAAALSERHPKVAWECSHTGGHRFAGVMICLPHGICYGRLDPRSALAAARAYADRRVEPAFFRGRTSLEGSAQAAEAYLRLHAGIDDLDGLTVDSIDDGGGVVLTGGAASYRVRVRQAEADPPRAASCRDIGTNEKRPAVWLLESVERIDGYASPAR